MKKILCLLLAALCTGVFAQQKFEISAALDRQGENIFAPGSMIPVAIQYRCPADYQLRAWSVSAYAKNVPESFGKAMKLSVRGKDPKWQGFSFHPWKWISNVKSPLKVSFSTKGFPEGDYRITVNTLFRKTGAKGHKTDRYVSKVISFSIEK
ncbi:MAG: hypothetical protein J6S58_05305 [Lentisphaeria bacterium]|nr:hypothetical protein [Lentisphaeria bacterium]